MTDFGRITDDLLDFLSQGDNGRLDEESDDPLWVGIRRGEGDTLDVSIDGINDGGDSEPVAKFRVTVERVATRPEPEDAP